MRKVPSLAERGVFYDALEIYGIESQVQMVIEGCSELIKECCKFLRIPSWSGRALTSDMIDELVDVQIMLDQMYLYALRNADGEDIGPKLEERRNFKVQRLKNRLDAICEISEKANAFKIKEI